MQEVGYFPLGSTFNGKFLKTKIDKAGLRKYYQLYKTFGLLYKTFDLLYNIFDLLYNIFDLLYETFDLLYNIFDLLYETFNLLYNIFGLLYKTFDLLYNIFDLLYKTFLFTPWDCVLLRKDCIQYTRHSFRYICRTHLIMISSIACKMRKWCSSLFLLLHIRNPTLVYFFTSIHIFPYRVAIW
ncbi:MAG: hypothetical protein H6Q14_2706 [Bacteroidetes bacterium]|nr:hypothetical protein [Bacteroidota bacterium]